MKPAPPAPPSQLGAHASAAFTARILVGLALVISGAMKAAAPAEEFSIVIENYRLIPDDMTLTFATMMPWLELFSGLALVLGAFTRLASAAAGAMLASFIFALLSTKLRGIELPHCGCFGGDIHLTAWQAILLDSFLSACAWLSFKYGSLKASLDNWVNAGL